MLKKIAFEGVPLHRSLFRSLAFTHSERRRATAIFFPYACVCASERVIACGVIECEREHLPICAKSNVHVCVLTEGAFLRANQLCGSLSMTANDSARVRLGSAWRSDRCCCFCNRFCALTIGHNSNINPRRPLDRTCARWFSAGSK